MFLTLPHDILVTILSQYCSSLSLSTLLNTYTDDEIMCSIIKKCLKIKLSSLSSHLKRNASLPYQFRHTLDLADELNTDNDNEGININTLSTKLSILSFLEDNELQISTPSGIELPLWCGELRIRAHGRTYYINVLITTPTTSWHHALVHEWTEFSEYGLELSATPRNACPFPPIARIKGVTIRDNDLLLRLAKYVDLTNQAFCTCTHSRLSFMNVIAMSRTQALSKLSQMTISSKIKESMMATLNYDSNCSNSCNDKSNELFAFIEVQPYETIDDPSLNDIKNDILDIRKSYDLCAKK